MIRIPFSWKMSILFLGTCLSNPSQLFAQSNLPNSVVNFGVGAGINYGGIGTKTVLGQRNSGILVGLGSFFGEELGYEVGLQISEDWFYANLGYGVVAIHQVNDDPVETINGGILMVGGMVNLLSNKRLFLDIGAGHTFGAKKELKYGEINANGFTVSIGIAYRIGTAR